MPHVDLRGQVEHHLGPVLAEDGVQVGVDDVRFHERILGVADQVLDVGRAAAGEVVQADHRVAVGEQTVD